MRRTTTGAAALGLVAPFFGRTGGLISAPCAPAAAVLSALIAGMLGEKAGTALSPTHILPLLALTALLAAGLQIGYGVIGGGQFEQERGKSAGFKKLRTSA